MMESKLPPPAPEFAYRSVLAMIRERANRAPDGECLVALDQGLSMTWGQLYRITNKLSAWLHARGIGANDRVLVLTDNSLENLILYYGIQAYGATYCTVNIDVNPHHLGEMLDRIAPKAVFWQKGLEERGLVFGMPGTWIAFGAFDGVDDAAGSDEGERRVER